MLVSYYLPGNSLAPPPALPAHGHSAHTEEEQSLFDPFPYGWSAGGEPCEDDQNHVLWPSVHNPRAVGELPDINCTFLYVQSTSFGHTSTIHSITTYQHWEWVRVVGQGGRPGRKIYNSQ